MYFKLVANYDYQMRRGLARSTNFENEAGCHVQGELKRSQEIFGSPERIEL